MEKGKISIIFIALILISISQVSAEIILTQQKDLYNLGDAVQIPTTIKASSDTTGFFTMNLICNGQESEFYKEYIILQSGQEKKISPAILLNTETVGVLSKNCKVKATLGTDYALSNDFRVSNKININLKTESKEYSQEENIIIEGEAIKENGENVDGYIEITSRISTPKANTNITNNETNQNESINAVESNTMNIIDTVNNGYFLINFTLPKDAKAGQYQLNIKVFEKDSEGIETNNGLSSQKISIKQIPTSLEISVEEPIVTGEQLKLRTILRDQSGDKIDSTSRILIKDEKGKVQQEITEQRTDELIDYTIPSSQSPSKWTVEAYSNDLEIKKEIAIPEHKEIDVKIINQTLILKNIGNVKYNDTLTVAIGEENVYIDIDLDVNEEAEYLLSAPNGEYEINVLEKGDNKLTGKAILTGESVSVKKNSRGLFKFSFIWIFIILILGLVSYMIIKKGYQRSFIGRIIPIKNKEKVKEIVKEDQKTNLIERNTAFVSLSIKGERRPTDLICLKIKNANEVKISNAKEILKSITDEAEKNKAAYYENGDYIFFIISALNTKTFKNETNSIKLAGQIKEILDKHNKLAKQKIEYGISLNQGEVIATKQNANKPNLTFMSLGTLIGNSKKLAAHSSQEILLSETFNSHIMSNVKTEKHTQGNTNFYSIKEVNRLRDSEENKKFLNNFVKRLEKEKR